MDTDNTTTDAATASADDTGQQPAERTEFLAFLARLQHGRTADELTDMLAELTEAVNETGKPGTIMLSIRLTPDKRVAGAVTVEDTTGKKLPKLPRPATMMFANDDGTLTSAPKDQLSFDGFGGAR